MSIENTWDLQAKASPRSLAVFPVIRSTGHAKNPFDSHNNNHHPYNPFNNNNHHNNSHNNAAPPVSDAVVACVFGTERGSLHYRTYATTLPPPSTRSSSDRRVQLPLGQHRSSSSQQSQHQSLPRYLFPMDLGSLPGAVVACVALPLGRARPGQPSPMSYCLLVDDGGGGAGAGNASSASGANKHSGTSSTTAASSSNSNSNGSYASVIVTSNPQSPGFQVVAPAHTLPRMSCVWYDAHNGSRSNGGGAPLVYAAGRFVRTLEPSVYEPTADGRKSQQHSKSKSQQSQSSSSSSQSLAQHHHRQQQRRLIFDSVALPGLIRSGPDALVVTNGGQVAVVAVGNAFYAVAGMEPDDVVTSSASSSTSSNYLLKILTCAQSSQVHPSVALDLHDPSLDPDWSSLLLASGRECAVVDVYYSAAVIGYMGGGGASGSGTPYHTAPRSLLQASPPRHGTVTVASPILAAAATGPWVALLQSDGLVSIRSPSCLAIALRTVEVGTRPNDYFALRSFPTTTHHNNNNNNNNHPNNNTIVAVAFSGDCKVLQCHADSPQDLADRLMRHAIDAFGANGFPRADLEQAVGASLTSTSYVGPEVTLHSKLLLKQYLEAVLGLVDFESGGRSQWPTEGSHDTSSTGSSHYGSGGGGTFADSTATNQRGNFSGRPAAPTSGATSSPTALLTGTALLCLVCSQLSPPNSLLASRAAKRCAEHAGVVFASDSSSGNSESSTSNVSAATRVCDTIADMLLREASSKFSLSSMPIGHARNNRSSQSSTITEFVEASVYLLRSCGKHARAIEVAQQRLTQHGRVVVGESGSSSGNNNGGGGNQGTVSSTEVTSSSNVRGFWSQIKYESYMATHLSDIWIAGDDEGCRLVLESPATHQLLEQNPRLGLSVFTSLHPQNETQWRSMVARDDPLAHPDRVYQVLRLLKSVHPVVPYDKERSFNEDEDPTLPLESARAVTVSFLRSAIGISSERQLDDEEFDLLPVDADTEEHLSNFHDDLALLLLEGIIAERPDDESNSCDTKLGSLYRSMLRELLKWPSTKIRPEKFMESLPSTFLEEKALVLGRLGRFEDALRILYRDLDCLDLALEFCDDRYKSQKAQQERLRSKYQRVNNHNMDNNEMFPEMDQADELEMKEEDNAYLPLVRVALESDDSERGTATAIKVLALRRGAIDRAAALRLLPSEVPVSAVARPFLIPALVDSESQVRRLTVVSALLRSRYLRLKEKLTEAQLKAQSNLYVVPALRELNLGDPLQSTKSFRIRTMRTTPGSSMPYVEIVKHFFSRHLVIQVRVTNTPYSSSSSSSALYSSDKPKSHQTVLSDIAFVVAESSEEEAIQPMLQVPIQVLPPKMTGSAWCVLSAAPHTMDGPTAQLTCELRYSVQSLDAAMAALPTSMGQVAAEVVGRTFVEELQDLEVQAAHFSPKQHS